MAHFIWRVGGTMFLIEGATDHDDAYRRVIAHRASCILEGTQEERVALAVEHTAADSEIFRVVALRAEPYEGEIPSREARREDVVADAARRGGA